MFAFTSNGAKIDQTINDGSGPYVFNISGQVHHLMGSLLPTENKSPKFSQLYIYDSNNEIANRIQAVDSNGRNPNLDPNIVQGLITMFDENNELVKYFTTVKNIFDDNTLRTLN